MGHRALADCDRVGARATLLTCHPYVAEEGTWDIGEYDSCVRMPYNKIDKLMRDYVEHIRYCCWKSGGKWTGKKCVAPPADQPATTSSTPKLNIK